jgi:hypothetical protein
MTPLLAGVPLGDPKKLAKPPHIAEELLDVTDQLEELEAMGGQPWWERFDFPG